MTSVKNIENKAYIIVDGMAFEIISGPKNKILVTDLNDLKNKASFTEINGSLALVSSSFKDIIREENLNRIVNNNEKRLLEGLKNA